MSIENEIKKLNTTVEALTLAVHALVAIAGNSKPTPAPEVSSEPEPTKPVIQAHADTNGIPPPDITRKELGEYLRNLALKYGDEAQEMIGDTILKVAGTQALSQVDDNLLGNIKIKVEMGMEAIEAGRRG